MAMATSTFLLALLPAASSSLSALQIHPSSNALAAPTPLTAWGLDLMLHHLLWTGMVMATLTFLLAIRTAAFSFLSAMQMHRSSNALAAPTPLTASTLDGVLHHALWNGMAMATLTFLLATLMAASSSLSALQMHRSSNALAAPTPFSASMLERMLHHFLWTGMAMATSTFLLASRTAAFSSLSLDAKLIGRTGSSTPFDGINAGDNASPFAADWDGDGDIDLLVGNFDGLMQFFERSADASLVERTGSSNPFFGIDVGKYAQPFAVDWDGDGDIDLLVGNQDGRIFFFERSANASLIERTGSSNPFDGIDVGMDAVPCAVDWDGAGDIDLLVGNSDGRIQFFSSSSLSCEVLDPCSPTATAATNNTNKKQQQNKNRNNKNNNENNDKNKGTNSNSSHNNTNNNNNNNNKNNNNQHQHQHHHVDVDVDSHCGVACRQCQ
ncbi:unnamed protein product [Polarella glacialis]|uniref:Uncharacterized protein n=1 Tax=Polarella glacialis TaxID=89957 RepID=A0A813LCX1_POLGL|nr:unnamed protein product [Polarella glacialis]